MEIQSWESVRPQKTRRPQLGPFLELGPGHPAYRVLVADDNADNRRLLVYLLTRLGFEVRTAQDGRETLTEWQAWRPHLIWMDIRMPGMDGREATRRIKAGAQGRNTKILALTANSFEEERGQILAAGCDDFLRKPFRENDLLEMMARHLGFNYIHGDKRLETPPGAAEGADLLTSLKNLPTDLPARLEQASVRAQMDEISRLIKQAKALSPEGAAGLGELANAFKYQQITELIRTLLES